MRSMVQLKRILVGVDGSENSLRAVRYAATLAKGFQAEVTLAHVVPPSDYALTSGKATYMEKDAKLGGERLRASEELLKKEKVPFNSVVEFGVPSEQLLILSKDHDAVVVGTRGLSPFKEALIGSTSHRLVQLGKVPVTIVP
ncbi:MAG: universal stress protein [Methanomassiliicoccales archaeon]|nr:universal stress protein [Methanomassiliicoccales archaeon]